MKSFGRRVLNVLAVTSLFFFIAIAVIDALSYVSPDYQDLRISDITALKLSNGKMILVFLDRSGQIYINLDTVEGLRRSAILRREAIGFEYIIYDNTWLGDGSIIAVPLWVFAAATSFMPMAAFVATIVRRRKMKLALRQICTHCGYDLRATPERCPKCGTAPTKP